MNLTKYINTISGLQAFQLMRFGTLLLISIVLAKSGIGTKAIGEYEIFLFITALVTSFWINGLIQSFLPLFRNNKTFGSENGKSPEIFNVFILISMMNVLVVVLLLILNAPLSRLVTSTNSLPFKELIVLYIFFSSPSFLIEYIYLLKQKPNFMLIYGITIFPVQFILVSTPAILGYSIEWCLTGLVFVSVIRFLWLLILLKKYAAFQFSLPFIREHLHFAYPLIMTTLLGASANYVDGFLVLNKFDRETFAVFRYGAREFPLILLMANALSNAMIPEFSTPENFNKSLQVLKRKSEKLMHTLFPVTMVFLFLSPWLYPVVFNPDFSESAVIFNIYLLLITSRLIFPHPILIGLKKTKVVFYASVAELLINVTLSLLFINLWGIEGVAFATVIAYASQKIIWLIYNKRKLNLDVHEYVPVKYLVIYSTLTLAIFISTYLVYF